MRYELLSLSEVCWTKLTGDSEQAPTYPLGFGLSVGATVLGAMIPATVHWILLRRENQRRDRVDAYSPEKLGEMNEESLHFRFTL